MKQIVRTGAFVPVVLLSGLPIFGLLNSNIPLLGRLGIGSLALMSLAWPANGLLVLAGLAPLGGVIGAMVWSPYSLTEPMVMAFLCGWSMREATWPAAPVSTSARRAIVPALLLAAVVAASGGVLLSALRPPAAHPSAFVRELVAYSGSTYFENWSRFPPLTSALGFLEGLGVFVAAVVLTDRRSAVAPLLARMTVFGALGVAALSLNRLMTIALRSGDVWSALRYHLPTIRISAAFGDLNAAGSYFALTLGVAIVAASVRPRWLLAVCPLLAALWLSGSRTALLATLMSSVGMVVIGTIRRPDPAWRRAAVLSAAGLTLATVLVALGVVNANVHRTVRLNVWRTAETRIELTQAAGRMVLAHPLFGVGIGQFLPASGEFFSPHLRRLFPRGENAHNNFLQVFGELGLMGAIPFTWVLLRVVLRLWAALRFGARDNAVLGTFGGLLAFLLSCLAGHPLLISEVRFAFWLLLGTAVGLTQPDVSGRLDSVRVAR